SSSTSLHAAGLTSGSSPAIAGGPSPCGVRGSASSTPGGIGGGPSVNGGFRAPKTRVDAASKIPRSPRREHHPARLAREDAPGAGAAAWTSAVPTGGPPAGIARATATTSSTIQHPGRADPIEVLADLQRHAERLVERAVRPQRAERLRPRDRLADARLLV